jgi:phosphomannomutase
MLQQHPGSSIVHDPRLYWDTLSTVESMGGKAVIAKVGHSNIKPAMRASNAPFAGEVSGHFYFRDFFFCDTGMLPMLLVLQYLGTSGQTLGQAVTARALATPASDEINFLTPTPAREFLAILKPHFTTEGEVTEVDGVSTATDTWRANIRASNTEPLLRLNIEARSPEKLAEQLEALTTLITNHGAHPADH